MKSIIGLVGAVFAAVVGVVVSQSISRAIDARTMQQAQLHALQIQQRAYEIEQARAQAAATAPASILITYALYALLIIALALIIKGLWERHTSRVLPQIVARNGAISLSREALMQLPSEAQAALFMLAYELDTKVRIEQAKSSVAAPHILHNHATTAALPLTTAAPAPTTEQQPLLLPEVAPLREALPAIPKGHIAYGRTVGRQLLSLPLSMGYHGLFTGDTRSGKSNAIDSMIVQLHHMSRRLPITLYAADYKQELASTWGRSPLFAAGIQTDPKQITDMLAYLVHGEDGIKARYAKFAAVGEAEGRIIRNLGDYSRITGQQPHLAVCFLDELNALLEAAGKDKELASNLKQALQMGAGAGIYITGGAQYLTAATFGRDGSKQFVTRALFGAFDTTAATMLFGSVDKEELAPYITGQAGRGLIRTVGKPEPVPFQALLTEEEDILEAIAAAAPPTTTALSPLISPQEAPEPVVVSPEPTEEERILAAATEYPSRTALCEALYGCSGGAPYRKVQQVLDGAGLLMPKRRAA